ncbi:MAG: DUF1674 domain-containing protein [Ponticaulis sp.]|nr:DUF1674 domain-containing protein [Ponticaulis sp.]
MADENRSEEPAKKRDIPADAQRALDEAAERRRIAEAEAEEKRKEINGPKGLEPTRHGDWERKGIAYDF